MITAHGTSDKRREALRKNALVVADGTCPLVRYAHEQLKRLVQAGYFPVVIGLANHVEVRGLVGDFADAFVINEVRRHPESSSAIALWDYFPNDSTNRSRSRTGRGNRARASKR